MISTRVSCNNEKKKGAVSVPRRLASKYLKLRGGE
jgi:hypothetical protein